MENILLTKIMERASLDLDSYDRIFPNQDTMPKGGFGNLIALPFQGESSKKENTVFVNKYFEVEKNQINILNNIKRIKSDEIYSFIETNKEDDYKEPEVEENFEMMMKYHKRKILKILYFLTMWNAYLIIKYIYKN